MDRSDTIHAAISLATAIGYVLLVLTGQIDYQPGVVESLLLIALAASGYDIYTDWARTVDETLGRIAERELDEP